MIRSKGINKFITNSIQYSLFYIPYLIFFILLSLCFFCNPSAEDLAINYYSRFQGLGKFIGQFYHSSGSRYFSFSLITWLCNGNFILTHYYIVSLFLFISLWLSLLFFVKTVTGVLTEKISERWIIWFSMTFLLAIGSVIFEMASFFYWMSGSITYLPSFIFFLLLLVTLIRLSIGGGKWKNPGLIFSMVLVILIAGTNEIGLYFLILFLLWAQLLCYSIHKKSSWAFSALLIVAILCFVFLIVPSGVSHRAGSYKINFSIGRGILISFGFTARVLFRAISSPLAWICMGLAGIAGSLTNENLKNKLSRNFLFSPVFLLLSATCAVFVFYFIVYIMSGELLAPRANNLILAYFFLVVLISCFSYGLRFNNEKIIIYRISRHNALRLSLIFLIITSSFMNSTMLNAFTGFIHKEIMDQRKNSIAASIQNNRHTVVLHPYQEDFDKACKKTVPTFLQKPLKRRMSDNTNWMNYQDPLADTARYIHYYAEYNNIDTINYNGLDYIRIGLLKKNQLEIVK